MNNIPNSDQVPVILFMIDNTFFIYNYSGYRLIGPPMRRESISSVNTANSK